MWDCKPSKGDLVNKIKELNVDHLDSCKDECLKETGCSAIDYSNINSQVPLPSAIDYNHTPLCRLFKKNEMRVNAGQDQRVYCELGNDK